jgi:hypothetical protein
MKALFLFVVFSFCAFAQEDKTELAKTLGGLETRAGGIENDLRNISGNLSRGVSQESVDKIEIQYSNLVADYASMQSSFNLTSDDIKERVMTFVRRLSAMAITIDRLKQNIKMRGGSQKLAHFSFAKILFLL